MSWQLEALKSIIENPGDSINYDAIDEVAQAIDRFVQDLDNDDDEAVERFLWTLGLGEVD